MCGIVGICLTDRAARVDEAQLARATDALRHRGPDGRGLLVDGHVGLGHRRLSIIDIAGGNQPIYNEDRSVAVVFNGEIYNYRELCRGLEQRGHRFATHSDTEVIVHAWEEFGERCVEHFTGMFAFAIWDRRSGTVFAARDRFGKKPLFYRHDAERLEFASELKALVADSSAPRRLNREALDEYFAYGYVPGDQCILAGVQKLAPGCWMRWNDGKLTAQRYWDVDLTPGADADERVWMERVEDALRRAVRLRLRADVPLGVFLSGGVDSSAIAALASQELGGPVRTFSVGFDETDFDELKYARLVAARYHSDHSEIVVRDQDVSVLGDLAYQLDEPFADPSALPTYYICREARKHVTVVLSGDGADELFAGYTRYRQALQYSRADWLPAGVRRAVGGTLLAVTPPQVWGRGLIQRISHNGAERYLSQMSSFSVSERRELVRTDARAGARCFEPIFNCGRNRDLVSILQQCDQKNYMPDDILVKTDRMAMQVSLELRCPFLDHHVAEAINAAPTDMKLRGETGKYLLKQLLVPHLPPEILARRKKGFGLPIKKWFRGALNGYARELLLDSASRAIRHVERGAVEAILRRHDAGMRDFSRKIWSLLMLEHWCRRYGV